MDDLEPWDPELVREIREKLSSWGVSPLSDYGHLQSLIWATRRDVLERIGGFQIGASYGEAVASEIATSKKVEMLGLQVRQVAFLPFTYIVHPQWKQPLVVALLPKATIKRLLPRPIKKQIRRGLVKLKHWRRRRKD